MVLLFYFYRLFDRIESTKLNTDFSIDPKHELAMFVWNDGSGPRLTHMKEFCSSLESLESWCVTTQIGRFPECGPPVGKDDLTVAVKTCSKFHKTRGGAIFSRSINPVNLIYTISVSRNTNFFLIHMLWFEITFFFFGPGRKIKIKWFDHKLN